MANKSTLLWIGGGALIAYLIYTKAKAAAAAVTNAAGAAYSGSVNTVSDFLSTLLGPTVTVAGMDYIATFPDGSRNAVPGNILNADGTFTWTGYPAGSQAPQTLQLMTGSDGNHYAIAAS